VAKKKPFNNPFATAPFRARNPEPPRRPDPPPRTKPIPSREPSELTEEELWTVAVHGAKPLSDRSGRIKPAPQPLSVPTAQLDPDLEAYDELRALVTGEVPFDIADSDEFIEGHSRGLDPRVVRKLRKGEFAVQAHVDLHGLLKDEAKAALEAFLARSRQDGKRCVLVVHGRGLHSKDQVPVLKEALKRWMHTARFARHVLGFSSARPHDGGTGAMYLLLRRLSG
jgi:DNA-nicking Smr family endonuclease